MEIIRIVNATYIDGNMHKAHILTAFEGMGLIVVMASHSIEVIGLLLQTHNRELGDCQ